MHSQVTRTLLVAASAALVVFAGLATGQEPPTPSEFLKAVSDPPPLGKLATKQSPAFTKGQAPVGGPALFLNPPAEPSQRSSGSRLARREVFDLEAAVGQAELILVARLADVTETKIVSGGRNEQVTQQYRLEPVEVIKGIFARETLLMTGQDLGISRFAEGDDGLERGQLLLVLLGRQNGSYFNCNTDAGSLGQSIPRISGADDPLVSACATLVGISLERDRAKRVRLLVDGLAGTSGRAASPLLLALGRRALIASQAPGVLDAILPRLADESAAVRELAARTLGDLLKRDYLVRDEFRTRAAQALAKAIDTGGSDVQARVALIDAIGLTGSGDAARAASAGVFPIGDDSEAATLVEQAARLRAYGRLGNRARTDEVARRYESLPLDADPALESAAAGALIELDPARAAEAIAARLDTTYEAGLKVSGELQELGLLSSDLAAPRLLTASNRLLDPDERLAFAQACRSAADSRLVPVLATLLDPSQYQTRAIAVEALLAIDNDEAASVLQPHLGEEGDLGMKLRLVAFLNRHGLDDGFALALEHLSQVQYRDQAVEALASMDADRVVPELRRILEISRDLSWNASAILALGRLGQVDYAPRFLEIADDPRDPLAEPALRALGELGEPKALPIVADWLGSRDQFHLIAAAETAGDLLRVQDLDPAGVPERLAALLADFAAPTSARLAALEALNRADSPQIDPALAEVARDANLENTPLLARVEFVLAARKVPVAVPKSSGR